jgi:cell division protein FtsQ
MKKILYMLFIIPICILSMLSIIYLFSKKEPLFFLQNVKISGISQLNDKDIMGKISPFLKESLLSIDVVKMKDIIAAHPFVKEVRIKRVYPFSIVIDVKEKTPSALWVNRSGELSVLDEYGEPFRKLAKEETKGLYIINAKEKADARSLFNEINGWISEGVLKKEKISEVAYDEGSITIFGLDDPVEIILGKEEQRTRLKRALTVLEDAKKRGLLIKCIDARFEKGAIIQERKG